MNSRALVQLDDEEIEVALVYPEDANSSAGKHSVCSDLGAAILGYQEGDAIDWRIAGRTRQIEIGRCFTSRRLQGISICSAVLVDQARNFPRDGVAFFTSGANGLPVVGRTKKMPGAAGNNVFDFGAKRGARIDVHGRPLPMRTPFFRPLQRAQIERACLINAG